MENRTFPILSYVFHIERKQSNLGGGLCFVWDHSNVLHSGMKCQREWATYSSHILQWLCRLSFPSTGHVEIQTTQEIIKRTRLNCCIYYWSSTNILASVNFFCFAVYSTDIPGVLSCSQESNSTHFSFSFRFSSSGKKCQSPIILIFIALFYFLNLSLSLSLFIHSFTREKNLLARTMLVLNSHSSALDSRWQDYRNVIQGGTDILSTFNQFIVGSLLICNSNKFFT